MVALTIEAHIEELEKILHSSGNMTFSSGYCMFHEKEILDIITFEEYNEYINKLREMLETLKSIKKNRYDKRTD